MLRRFTGEVAFFTGGRAHQEVTGRNFYHRNSGNGGILGGDAEPSDVDGVVRVVPEPVGRAAVLRNAEPGAAAQ